MRRASGINPFIFIPKLVDSNRKYISYGFRTIYSLLCKLNLDLKFLISFHENIILFLFLFLFLFFFIENIILFLFYFYFILFLLFYFILFFLIFIFYLFILFYFIFFIKRNVYQHF